MTIIMFVKHVWIGVYGATWRATEPSNEEINGNLRGERRTL